MGLRALNNPKSSFEDPYASTGLDAVNDAPAGPISATGGTKYTYSGKVIHKFTADGNFVVASGAADCEVVVVAGGGGGGAYRGAGGGAGGYVWSPDMPFGTGTHAVVVGDKGNKGTAPGSGTDVDATNGGDSTLTNGHYTVTAKGGGYGGGGNHSGNPGGSGGGGTWPVGQSEGEGTQPTQNPGFPFTIDNNGMDGGDSSPGPPKYGSGGGGAAAGAGLQGDTTYGGNGALGKQLPTTFQDPTNPVGYPGPGSTTFWLAGGGGGGAIFAPVPQQGLGGCGPPTGGPYCGAGNGGPASGGNAANASVNSGSGGGGSVCIGDPYGDQRSGGDGGSGIVLIAYPE